MTAKSAESDPTPRPITSLTEAGVVAARFAQVMDDLVELIEEETKLVRTGQARTAAVLQQKKRELTGAYLADAARVKASRGYLRQHTPALLNDLQERHDRFRALLQINLTVLATAHAVAEGLVRGVSGELARKSSPQTYTSYGCSSAPPSAAPPIAVSRQL